MTAEQEIQLRRAALLLAARTLAAANCEWGRGASEPYLAMPAQLFLDLVPPEHWQSAEFRPDDFVGTRHSRRYDIWSINAKVEGITLFASVLRRDFDEAPLPALLAEAEAQARQTESPAVVSGEAT